MTPRRIAVVTNEVIGERIAGPAIRALAMADALAADAEVTLLAAAVGADPSSRFATEVLTEASAARVAATADVVVVGGDVLEHHRALAASDACVVADLYDPYHLEALERTRELAPERRRVAVGAANHAIRGLLARGDVFLTAGGRQRDLWIGALAALGRVNEHTYDASPDLAGLVLDVPFGVPDAPPAAATAAVLRGVLPGVDADALVLWWGGGIYPWLDPLVVLDAVEALTADGVPAHVVFAGTRHPNPEVGEMPVAAEVRAAAQRRGLLDRCVHLLDWVPYTSRAGYLLEADVVVSAHRDHVETRYSYRTRLLDALWAGRPTVATGGDELMDGIAAAGGGRAVPEGDATAFATAVREYLDADRRAAAGARAAELGAAQRWSTVLAPLVAYCADPQPAADRAAGVRVSLSAPRVPLKVRLQRMGDLVSHGRWDELGASVRRRLPHS